MVHLSADDRKRLLKLLIPLPILANERGRESVIASANLDELRPQLDLSGPPAVAIPLMVSSFCSYGRLTYEHEALGRFLNTLRDYVGLEERGTLDQIVQKYSLMTPVAKSIKPVDWVVPITAGDVLEKIIGENTLRPIAFLQQGLIASRSVAYVEVSASDRWSGTGFMISPDLLLTNHHVLPARSSLAGAVFRFNYQDDYRGNPEIFEDYAAAQQGIYNASEALDYAVVGIAGAPGHRWGYLGLGSEIPAVGSRVNVIQHPGGLPKQISLQNNFVRFADATRIQYVTSTLPGSSGAPVFNDHWEVIGLHHAGGWLPESEGGPLYFRNEGIAARAILDHLPDEIKGRIPKARSSGQERDP